MSENRSDPSEPIWELEDFLGEGAEEFKEDETEPDHDSTTSQENPNGSVTEYDLEKLMEEGGEETGQKSGPDSSGSNRFSRLSTALVTTVCLLVAVFAYVTAPFGSGATDNNPAKSVGSLSKQNIQSWLEQSQELVSALSREDLPIHSSSVLGFSSELSKRTEVKRVVRDTLVGMTYSEYRATTRDIGNALKLMDIRTKTEEDNTSGSFIIHQNNQVVKEFRNDVLRVMQQLRNAKGGSPANTELSPSPVKSASHEEGSPGIK